MDYSRSVRVTWTSCDSKNSLRRKILFSSSSWWKTVHHIAFGTIRFFGELSIKIHSSGSTHTSFHVDSKIWASCFVQPRSEETEMLSKYESKSHASRTFSKRSFGLSVIIQTVNHVRLSSLTNVNIDLFFGVERKTLPNTDISRSISARSQNVSRIWENEAHSKRESQTVSYAFFIKEYDHHDSSASHLHVWTDHFLFNVRTPSKSKKIAFIFFIRSWDN